MSVSNVSTALLNHIVMGKDLGFQEAHTLFNEMLKESEVKIAAILAALQTKGYQAEEIAGFAQAMREKAVKVEAGSVTDTCGTGGDFSSTINVSTATAILLSCFTPVAKHGNVSITSKSGSANVLEELGIKIRLEPEEVTKNIKEKNFAFIFAPLYHPALKKIMPVRKELGIKTIFNILGPLCNPAKPEYQLMGVSSPDLLEKVAKALGMLGAKKALVVYGKSGRIDEVCPFGETEVVEVVKGKGMEKYSVSIDDFGLNEVKLVKCNSAKESAERIEAVFKGKGREEDLTFILVNASTALYASEVVSDLKEGVEVAKNVLEESKVLRKLEELRA